MEDMICYFDELATNLPTIQICLNKLSEAKKTIDFIEKRIESLNEPRLDFVRGKLKLIKKSAEISDSTKKQIAENKIFTACERIKELFKNSINSHFQYAEQAQADVKFLHILCLIHSFKRSLQLTKGNR